MAYEDMYLPSFGLISIWCPPDCCHSIGHQNDKIHAYLFF